MSGINVTNLSFKADPQINAAPLPSGFDTLAPMPAELAGMPQSIGKDTVSLSQQGAPAATGQEEPKKGTSWLKIGLATLSTAALIIGLHSAKPNWFGPAKNLGTKIKGWLNGHTKLQQAVEYPTRLFNWIERKGKSGWNWVAGGAKNIWNKIFHRGEKAAENNVAKVKNVDGTTESVAVDIVDPVAKT
jgi:hypothetical protein